MLISDSLPLLWLSYVVLSLVVLLTGYLGIRFLPRLPRLIVTGLVAGMLWAPAPFSIVVVDAEQSYSGVAPAVVVTAVGVLQHDTAQISVALPLLLVGMGVGAVAGVLLWVWRRRRDAHDDEPPSSPRGGPRRETSRDDGRSETPRRREPVLG
ncbi:hypothetical protein GCM10027040_20700 [Halomonas shantousis]